MTRILIMKTSDGGERPFRLTKPRTLIGRNTASDLRIAVPTVSDRHCEIIMREGAMELRDLGTPLGTFHNGNRVETAILDDADTITVGPVTFEVRFDNRSATTR